MAAFTRWIDGISVFPEQYTSTRIHGYRLTRIHEFRNFGDGGPTPNRTGIRALGKPRFIRLNYGTLAASFNPNAP